MHCNSKVRSAKILLEATVTRELIIVKRAVLVNTMRYGR
jgi:hypothetical protein